jgi:hypothetical protein
MLRAIYVKKLNLSPSDTENLSSWVSEGKLLEPSPNLISMVAKCDDLLDVFHGKGIKVGKNPLEKVTTFILADHPDFPPKIVNQVLSRMKDLNNIIKLSRVKTVWSLKQIVWRRRGIRRSLAAKYKRWREELLHLQQRPPIRTQ